MSGQIVTAFRDAQGRPRPRLVEHAGTAPVGPELERLHDTAISRCIELEIAHEPTLS